MRMERRSVMRAAFAYSISGLIYLPGRSEAQGFAAPLVAALADVAPDYMAAVWDFGKKILPDVTAGVFSNWLTNRLVTPSPPPETFHDQFGPSVQFVLDDSNPPFSGNASVNDRKLVVDEVPNIAHASDSANQNTQLNVPEMKELGNQQNGLLYTPSFTADGTPTLSRLPVTSGIRRQPADADIDGFNGWLTTQQAYNSIGVPFYYNGESIPLNLDYVRNFCRCDGTPLIGYGFREAYNGVPHFAIANAPMA